MKRSPAQGRAVPYDDVDGRDGRWSDTMRGTDDEAKVRGNVRRVAERKSGARRFQLEAAGNSLPAAVLSPPILSHSIPAPHLDALRSQLEQSLCVFVLASCFRSLLEHYGSDSCSRSFGRSSTTTSSVLPDVVASLLLVRHGLASSLRQSVILFIVYIPTLAPRQRDPANLPVCDGSRSSPPL